MPTPSTMDRKRPLTTPLRRSKRLQIAEGRQIHEENVSFSSSVSSSNSASSSEHTDDQFGHLESEESEIEGEECVLHVYDNRFDTRGDHVLLRAGTNLKISIPIPDSRNAGFVVIRHYSRSKVLFATEFEVRSPFATKALREVIKDYPGVNIGSKGKIILLDQPRCLFHWRTELKAYGDAHSDMRVQEHVRFCLKYMSKVLNRELGDFYINVEENRDRPGLEFQNLWMAFRPGSVGYEKDSNRNEVVRIKSVQLMSAKHERERSYWMIFVNSLAWDGDHFGLEHHMIRIDEFTGIRPFMDLNIIPLEYHDDGLQRLESLICRGRKLVSLAGIRYCHYKGTARVPRNRSGAPPLPPNLVTYEPIEINERIILDEKLYLAAGQNSLKLFPPGTELFPPDPSSVANLTDDDLLIACTRIGGFALGIGEWALFNTDQVRETNGNPQAFSSLSLSFEKKSLISSLVTSYTPRISSGDIIREKGKGLIFLLHGPPGVGKTFTAESIADYINRPLYRLSSHEVLDEAKLVQGFRRAQRWGAVVLLDEADVFMQKRDLNNTSRNSAVSTLLRHVEYFSGILFLTTNRVHTIDEAFKSRIHLSISYPPLSYDSKKEVWEKGLIRANVNVKPQWLTRRVLDQLAKEDINGREINNLITMAHTLALSESRSMKRGDVLRSLGALKSFNEEMKSGVESTLEEP
ncbi:P-loop containing nucleoside triphosphate hydrolase protein [Xylariaceae sp. FL0255]|nr:P-loop containing nucleoside triphosphate hydrolase protein [Xylariaceae sp. FL0255]